jgi:glycosyltransferase involved in cell wall biosynthesis
MMNILFVVPYVPNLVRVRPYNLIRSLTRRGHRLTVLTLTTGPADEADVQRLRGEAAAVEALSMPQWRSLLNSLLGLPSRAPLQTVYSWQPALAQRLAALAAGGAGRPAFDVAHIEHLRGARYGLHLQAAQQGQPRRTPVVWDSVDSISFLFRQAAGRSRSLFGRVVTRIELGRTEAYERLLPQRFEHTLVTSRNDRAAFLALQPPGPPPPISILPNGVDLDYFQPPARPARQPDSLVISGKMSYHANVTMVLKFVGEILPRIWENRPQVRLTVVGKDPPAAIRALANDQRITVTGTVPDLVGYLQEAAVAVAPIAYGAGIQNKVLEAMACATPVVASPAAVAALDLASGREALVAEEAAEFARAALSLLESDQRRVEVGRAGRAYVERRHRWSEIAAQLETIYELVTKDYQK